MSVAVLVPAWNEPPERVTHTLISALQAGKTRAAEQLRITFRALRYYVQKYGLRAGPSGDGSGDGS